MAPHVFLLLFNSNHQAAQRNNAVYHGTAAICISIELYEIVQLRSGDGVDLPLTLTIGIVGLTLRGVRLLFNFYLKKEPKKKKKHFFNLAKKFVKRTVR